MREINEVKSPAKSSTPSHEPARQNDAAATFEEYRPLLLSVGYRMLGSRADAEDMVQETFLRWQKTEREQIGSPRAFLVTVVTRLCVNYMQSARVRREEYFGQWLPEPVVTHTASNVPNMPGLDGSLSIAFLLLLERLSPSERAVFLLREVFEYDYSDIASILGESPANCRQLLRRARQHMTQRRKRFEASRQRSEELLRQFIQTSLDGDMQAMVSLLSEDVVLYTDGGGKASALPNPIYGADKIARFFASRDKFMPAGVTRQFVEVNGQPGVVAYQDAQVFGVLSVDVVDGKIHTIYIVRNPDKLAHIPGRIPHRDRD